MSRLVAVKLLVGEVIDGGVYEAGEIVHVPAGFAGDLVRQEKAEIVDDGYSSSTGSEEDEEE